MAKTDFSKAEASIADALEKMKVQELLEGADAASGKANPSVTKERLPIIHALQRDLRRIYLHDPDIYKKLHIKRSNLNKLLETATTLNDEEWQKLLTFKTKVDAYVSQMPPETSSNEDLVEDQRKKHINKRFNVSDKWLPLK